LCSHLLIKEVAGLRVPSKATAHGDLLLLRWPTVFSFTDRLWQMSLGLQIVDVANILLGNGTGDFPRAE